MSPKILCLAIPLLLVNPIVGQIQESYSVIPSTAIPSNLLTPIAPTAYAHNASASISTSSVGNSSLTATVSSSSSSMSLLGITGANPSNLPTGNATASGTTTSTRPQATNSQPCNGYVEFCDRRLSNISMVVAHNSPFVVPQNAASNQMLKVETQLNDGIRGLQFETHYINNTLRLCHTSCDLLDVGPLQDYLQTVAVWLQSNPFEVITIMMGNDARVAPTTYIEPFQNAGLIDQIWVPPTSNLTLDQWPTLAEMIIQNKRIVVMLDYLANQQEVPWLLDEFLYQWQTPFSPTDPAFPCTEQRPPNQADDVSRNKMFVANHNLNVAINIGSVSLLIPAYSLLEEVNAVSGNGSLGRMVNNCTGMWGRPPNWLLVDFYNLGNFNGSVFQVAATANNVSYNRDSCCGTVGTSAAHILRLTLGQKTAVFGVLMLLSLL